MIGTKQILIAAMTALIAAFAFAAPATARDYTSVNAALNDQQTDQRTAPQSGAPNAILNSGRASGRPSAVGGNRSTPNAILGERSTTGAGVVPVVEVAGSSSFDWTAAAIGAGSAVALLLVASAAAFVTRRRRQPTVQPTT